MIKQLLIALSLSLLSSIACANVYIYVENPDPSKFVMTWDGPGPNCSEKNNGYETNGWIVHDDSYHNASPVTVQLKLKEDTDLAICDIHIYGDSSVGYKNNCNSINTGNTHWVTVRSSRYNPYKTWACG